MNKQTVTLQPSKLLLALAAAIPALAAQAQNLSATNSEVELKPVVVTASATAIDVKDAPASISVITAEDIAKMPSADLNEVLRKVPGLTQATSPDGGTSIQIRGLPQQYTLILIDGQRAGSSSETFDRYTRNEVAWLPTEMIERIEVVRGPMSSLYGSDALGGVINIITKKAGARWTGSLTTGAELNADSKRGDDYLGSFFLAGPIANGLSLKLSGQQSYRQADRALEPGASAFRWGGGREGSKVQSLGAHLDWDLAPGHRIGLDYQIGEWRTLAAPEGDASNPSGFSTSSFTRGPSKMQRESVALRYEGNLDIGKVKASLMHAEYRNQTTAPVIVNGQLVPKDPPDSRDPYLAEAARAVARDLIADASLTTPLKLGVDQLLTVGVQAQRSELNNPNSVGALPNAQNQVGQSSAGATSFAVFAEDQIFLRDNLTLTLGLRADHHEISGSRISPRSYLVYHPAPQWTVRGGYSEGFRAPTLRQTNANFVLESAGAGCTSGYQGGGCFTRGNPSLEAETSKNWELGVAWDRDAWNAGLTFFNTQFKNKIHERGLGYLGGGTRYWQEYVNIASAVTRGLEASVSIPLVERANHPWLKNLTWTSSITHMLKAENTSNGEPLSATPRWAATSSLDWSITEAAGATFGAEFIGKQVNLAWRDANNDTRFGDQRIATSYVIYDLGLRYRLNKSLRINGGIKNVFDRNPNGDLNAGNNFYTPGRRYFASLTASF